MWLTLIQLHKHTFSHDASFLLRSSKYLSLEKIKQLPLQHWNDWSLHLMWMIWNIIFKGLIFVDFLLEYLYIYMQYLLGCRELGGSTGMLTVTGMLSETTTIGLVMVFIVLIIMRRMLSTLREVQASSGNIHYKERSRNVRTRSRCNLRHMGTTILREHHEPHSWDKTAYYNKQAACPLLWGDARFWNLLQFGKQKTEIPFVVKYYWFVNCTQQCNTGLRFSWPETLSQWTCQTIFIFKPCDVQNCNFVLHKHGLVYIISH